MWWNLMTTRQASTIRGNGRRGQKSECLLFKSEVWLCDFKSYVFFFFFSLASEQASKPMSKRLHDKIARGFTRPATIPIDGKRRKGAFVDRNLGCYNVDMERWEEWEERGSVA